MPRKKAEKLVEEQEEFDVDEPSEVEELENNATDDDWTPAEEEKKPGRPQRASRNRKPIKLSDGKTTSDEDEDDDEEEEDPEESRGTKRKRGPVATRGGGRGRGRGRGGASAPASIKRAKADENGKGRGKKKAAPAAEGEGEEEEMDDIEDEEGMDDEEESVSDEEDSDDSETEDSEIPAEFRSGRFVLLKSDFDNKEENYPLWKIDGKSLLQKFDKFMHNNEELYKGTTIYAGWSKAIIDTYYPINVEYKTLENGESTVKFDPSQITSEMQKSKPSEKVDDEGEGEEEEEDEEGGGGGEEKGETTDAESADKPKEGEEGAPEE